jgi:hypothetical protein
MHYVASGLGSDGMEHNRSKEAQIARNFRAQAAKARALAADLEGQKSAELLWRLAAELIEASEKLERAV